MTVGGKAVVEGRPEAPIPKFSMVNSLILMHNS
jgi:hypothetical protein